MRLPIIFHTAEPLFLPWHYPQWLQGLVYRTIGKASPRGATLLHEEGFKVGTHRYKLLTFSWLLGKKAEAGPGGIRLHPPLHWWVASPLSVPLEALATGLLAAGIARLGDTLLTVQRVATVPLPALAGRVL